MNSNGTTPRKAIPGASSVASDAREGLESTSSDPTPFESVGCNVFEAPPEIGPLFLAWVAEGLVFLNFEARIPSTKDLARYWPEAEGGLPERPIPAAVEAILRGYFAGEAIDPATLPVRMLGTRFQRRTWDALRRVGRGAVRTYAALAGDVGSPRAMRAIGVAMGANPIAIVAPCHRVVAAHGDIGGYSGGLARKRWLLSLEGVSVDADVVRPGQLGLGALISEREPPGSE